MSRGRILMIFGSSFGQTARIANRIRRVLEAAELEVTLAAGADVPSDVSLAEYEGVIVGSSVIGGRHNRHVQRFVREHVRELNRMPSAFYSVSASAGSPVLGRPAIALGYIEAFLSATGWRPYRAVSVAGTIAYRQYNFILRWVMKRIAARTEMATDTTRDHEYTDWAEVERFADSFAAMMPVPREVEGELALT